MGGPYLALNGWLSLAPTEPVHKIEAGQRSRLQSEALAPGDSIIITIAISLTRAQQGKAPSDDSRGGALGRQNRAKGGVEAE